jgi:hypothetical protein
MTLNLNKYNQRFSYRAVTSTGISNKCKQNTVLSLYNYHLLCSAFDFSGMGSDSDLSSLRGMPSATVSTVDISVGRDDPTVRSRAWRDGLASFAYSCCHDPRCG